MNPKGRKATAGELSKPRVDTEGAADAQQRIEAVIRSIPPGRVSSYGQVADLAGLPGRARLTARVLRVTAAPLPWFRVLRSDGRIAIDPASPWHDEQVQRLRTEGVEVLAARVDLARFGWHAAVTDLLAAEMLGLVEVEVPERPQRKASKRSR
jgi:methylated-DNA-protein-cysteine methyltransferase related protein